MLQSVVGEFRVCHGESAAVARVCEQAAAYLPQWLNANYPIPERCWHILKVRQMGETDSYHRCFATSFPAAHEIRLVAFSHCGRERYRLDAVSFDADRLGEQLVIVPIVGYTGCEMPA